MTTTTNHSVGEFGVLREHGRKEVVAARVLPAPERDHGPRALGP